MTIYRADAPPGTFCPGCSDKAPHLCWHDGGIPVDGRIPVFCDNCCPHDHHDEDTVMVAKDNVELIRSVKVTATFEVFGLPEHVDKLVGKVDKELKVKFGTLYKGIINE